MANLVQISIIIPASFELDTAMLLADRIGDLSSSSNIKEIVIVISENTAQRHGYQPNEKISVVTSKPQRAAAMNAGAKSAKGAILYFLHSDSHPPPQFDTAILDAYKKGAKAGCFRLKFDDNSRMLRLFAFFTRLNWYWVHFGDQSLYIDRQLFGEVGCFDETLTTMEDIEFVGRIKKHLDFTVINREVVTSTRKYKKYGYLKVQLTFVLAVSMYLLGFPQNSLLKTLNNIKSQTSS